MLYKVGHVTGVLAIVMFLFFCLSLLGVFACHDSNDGENEKKCFIATCICGLIFLTLLVATVITPNFNEVKGFVVLKVGSQAANNETAQRLIDAAISKLEEKENK